MLYRPQVLDWFKQRGLEAYSISCGQSLLYNNIFPKHKVGGAGRPGCPPVSCRQPWHDACRIVLTLLRLLVLHGVSVRRLLNRLACGCARRSGWASA
jgi:hypothetical protein